MPTAAIERLAIDTVTAPSRVRRCYDLGMTCSPGPPQHPGAGVARAVADVERAVDALERLVAAQRETIGLLAIQLAARTREVQELHELLRAAQAHAVAPQPRDALPSPHVTYEAIEMPPQRVRRRRPRWRRWLGRVVLGE